MDEYIRKKDVEQKAIKMYGFGENKYVPLSAIKRIPAVDVAPVVCCKDCKHLYPKDMSMFCPFCICARRPDGFCELGERSDGND